MSSFLVRTTIIAFLSSAAWLIALWFLHLVLGAWGVCLFFLTNMIVGATWLSRIDDFWED